MNYGKRDTHFIREVNLTEKRFIAHEMVKYNIRRVCTGNCLKISAPNPLRQYFKINPINLR
jgi:hypothetical protein